MVTQWHDCLVQFFIWCSADPAAAIVSVRSSHTKLADIQTSAETRRLALFTLPSSWDFTATLEWSQFPSQWHVNGLTTESHPFILQSVWYLNPFLHKCEDAEERSLNSILINCTSIRCVIFSVSKQCMSWDQGAATGRRWLGSNSVNWIPTTFQTLSPAPHLIPPVTHSPCSSFPLHVKSVETERTCFGWQDSRRKAPRWWLGLRPSLPNVTVWLLCAPMSHNPLAGQFAHLGGVKTIYCSKVKDQRLKITLRMNGFRAEIRWMSCRGLLWEGTFRLFLGF